LRVFDALRDTALPVPPPGEPVPDDEGEAQTDDELGQEILEIEDVAHFWAR
jgi:hypothetical protein